MDANYYYGNQIKEDGWVRNAAMWDRKETHRILNEKSKGKRHLKDLNVHGMVI